MPRESESRSLRRDSGISIMARMIGLLKPLIPIMFLAIALGVIGFLCAIFLTVLAGYGLAEGVAVLAGQAPSSIEVFGFSFEFNLAWLVAALFVLAVARGLLHYGEQYCNHYIAFTLLATVRHKVFAVLRKLSPAKLEGRDKGDLVSLITSDIELLEVFYAHTISPVAIALIVSAIMVAFLGAQHIYAGIIGLCAYVTLGVIVPLVNGSRGADLGLEIRNDIGELESYVLDSLYGLDETIQYEGGQHRAEQIDTRSASIGKKSLGMNKLLRAQEAGTNVLIQIFSWAMLATMIWLYLSGAVGFTQAVVASIAMMSSFGPVVALSNLSTTLSATLASGQRVLDLLAEEPKVQDVVGEENTSFEGASLEGVSFAYEDEKVLSDYSIDLPLGQVIGIHGPSGSGKSTMLKLLMRFWDVDGGSAKVSGRDVRKVNTDDLRRMQSYVTQETWLFNSSIADNIAIGNEAANRSQIIAAAKKASLHEFIQSLPDGYDTNVGELGDNLSDGERQRIGLARAFLHRAPLLLLDEPTSNLDSINEAVILKSLSESREGETVVLVSHRASTMAIADRVVEMDAIAAS